MMEGIARLRLTWNIGDMLKKEGLKTARNVILALRKMYGVIICIALDASLIFAGFAIESINRDIMNGIICSGVHL